MNGSDVVVVSSTALARVSDVAERGVVLYPRRTSDDGSTVRLCVEFWTGATVVGRYIDVPAHFNAELIDVTEQALVVEIYTEQTGRVVSDSWTVQLPEHEVRT
ncbi:hypothetical protein SEA_SCHOTTB_80 [Gordonia Phage SchottB]|nr:hypothetical protein SEA_SCHOTTB_80 [Gordonia Phage SchottB]